MICHLLWPQVSCRYLRWFSAFDVAFFGLKALDFCYVGILVRAVAESTTEFGRFVSDAGLRRNNKAGRTSGLLKIIEERSSTPALLVSMVDSARRQYGNDYNANNAAISLTEMVQNG